MKHLSGVNWKKSPYQKKRGEPVSRILSTTTISLAPTVAGGVFATNPSVQRIEPILRPYLVLLRVGFAKRRVTTDTRELLPHDFTIAGFAP